MLALHLLARVLAHVLHDRVDHIADCDEDRDKEEEEDEGEDVGGFGFGFGHFGLGGCGDPWEREGGNWNSQSRNRGAVGAGRIGVE